MVWKAKSNHFRLGERNSLFLHEFDAARSTDAGGSGFDHGEHFLAGMDTTTGLDAHIRSNCFAHKLNGLNGRAAFGETGRGLHEVRASGFAGFAGRDDFIIGEKAGFEDDLKGLAFRGLAKISSAPSSMAFLASTALIYGVFAPNGKPMTVQTLTSLPSKSFLATGTKKGLTQTDMKSYSLASAQSFLIPANVASGLSKV